MRLLRLWIFVAALLPCFATTVYGTDLKFDRATLRGIEAIRVIVEVVDSDVETVGLTSAIIRTDVELRLRQSRIMVLDETPITHPAILYVGLGTYISESHLVAYRINVGCYQEVLLDRNPKISTLAATWELGSTGIVGTSRISTVREEIKNYIDKFINAYLSVNPK